MERIFHLKENGTTVKTEILAGLTTFMTMAYIIALNPNLLTNFDTADNHRQDAENVVSRFPHGTGQKFQRSDFKNGRNAIHKQENADQCNSQHGAACCNQEYKFHDRFS